MSETILNMLPLTEEEKAVFETAAPDAVHLYAGRRTATPEQFAQATVILGWPRPNMVAQAAHLKWFHCMWAGTEEYVDVMPAGAALTSSAGTNSQSVSEHLLASLLALYRKLPLCRDRQREHKWDQDIGSVRTLVGATVLVAGAGHVGSAFAQLCKALGAKRTIGLKRSVNVPVPGFDELFPLSELDRLLPQADVVALTLPHTPETDGLMDRARLARMKEDAVLLSAGRGTVLDQDALVELMNGGHLWGAALDVTTPEPLPEDSPLWDVPNLLLTSHVAGGLRLPVTRENCVRLALENLKRYLAGEPLENVVRRG